MASQKWAKLAINAANARKSVGKSTGIDDLLGLSLERECHSILSSTAPESWGLNLDRLDRLEP